MIRLERWSNFFWRCYGRQPSVQRCYVCDLLFKSIYATLTHLSWPRSSDIHDSGVTENNMGWREMLSWHNKVIIYNVSSNCQKTLYSHLLTFVLLSCLGNELMIKESKTHRWPRGKNCNVLLYKTPYLKDSPPKSPFCLKFYFPPK